MEGAWRMEMEAAFRWLQGDEQCRSLMHSEIQMAHEREVARISSIVVDPATMARCETCWRKCATGQPNNQTDQQTKQTAGGDLHNLQHLGPSRARRGRCGGAGSGGGASRGGGARRAGGASRGEEAQSRAGRSVSSVCAPAATSSNSAGRSLHR